MATDTSFIQTQLREQVAIDRAAGDLRRGLPVVLKGDGAASIVFPAGLGDADRLERLRLIGIVQMLVSRERAAVLKIHHKGHEAIRLACPDSFTAATIRAIVDPTTDLSTPLKGPFEVTGTPDPAQEALDVASLKLLKIARLLPGAIIIPIDRGKADATAHSHGLLVAESMAVAAYDQTALSHLEQVARALLPVAGAENGSIVAFRSQAGGLEHFAIIIGDPSPSKPVLVRLHSECFTGDALGSLKCDCGNQLRGALEAIAREGSGILLYLAQEGRGIGLVAKLKAYTLQDQGYDTVDANLRLGFATDERTFGPASAMLRHLGFHRIRLLTNNPEKVAGLEAEGIAVTERVAHKFPANPHNAHYLETKRDKTGHFL